jgi:hypothetical protein
MIYLFTVSHAHYMKTNSQVTSGFRIDKVIKNTKSHQVLEFVDKVIKITTLIHIMFVEN